MSKVFLFLIYYIVLTPAALLRRMMGYDPMALRKWKQDHSSVFVDRNYSYTSKDLDSPE